MTCRHCHQPIQRCTQSAPHQCRRWVHAHNALHGCGHHTDMHDAEPEPGQLPTVQAPASKPDGAVA